MKLLHENLIEIFSSQVKVPLTQTREFVLLFTHRRGGGCIIKPPSLVFLLNCMLAEEEEERNERVVGGGGLVFCSVPHKQHKNPSSSIIR